MPAQDLADADGGSFAQNVEFFGSDLVTGGGPGGTRARRMRVTMIATTAKVIEATLDGTNFFVWTTTVANEAFIFSLPTRDTDLINFRTPDVAGVIFTFLRVDEIFGEA